MFIRMFKSIKKHLSSDNIDTVDVTTKEEININGKVVSTEQHSTIPSNLPFNRIVQNKDSNNIKKANSKKDTEKIGMKSKPKRTSAQNSKKTSIKKSKKEKKTVN